MKLPASFRPPPHYKPCFEEAFSSFPASSFGLLTTLLALYPTSRGSAASALQSEFFTSNPLAGHLSALPIPRKMTDESKTSERKKYMTSKAKKLSLTKRGGHQGNKPIELPSGAESYKEYAEPQMNSQEMWYSAINTSSSITTTTTMNEGSLHASLSPVFLSDKKPSPKTVGHPDALKNIKNPTLLQASIRDIYNSNEGRVLSHHRRSRSSTIDFQSLDPEKISQVLGFDKEQAMIKNNPFKHQCAL